MALKRTAAASLLAVAQLGLAAPSFAAEPSITSVSPDAALTTLEIRGTSFPSLALSTARQMRIYLRGIANPLEIASLTDTRAVAKLPAGLTPGTYRIALTDVRGGREYDTLAVTLGASGIPGPAGPGIGEVREYGSPGSLVSTLNLGRNGVVLQAAGPFTQAFQGDPINFLRTDEFVIDSAGLHDLTWITSNGNSTNPAKLGNGAISFTLVYD